MEHLSIFKKHFFLWLLITILVGSGSFAAGYLYRRPATPAPIIINQNN